MSGLSAASPAFRRTPLAIGLCLLAIVFAIEAKTAWFGPAAGPGSAVRAAKALPEGLPRLVDHGLPLQDPAHPHLHFSVPPASTAILLPRVKTSVDGEILFGHLPFFSAAYFSPSDFFRPPPVF